MDKFDWLNLDGVSVRFSGNQRGGDHLGHNSFAMRFDGGATYYGEFDVVFEDDGNHYNVVVLSFGFNHPNNVDNPNLGARAVFSEPEVRLIESNIGALFRADGEKPFPLTNFKDLFRGCITFKDGWIRVCADLPHFLTPY